MSYIKNLTKSNIPPYDELREVCGRVLKDVIENSTYMTDAEIQVAFTLDNLQTLSAGGINTLITYDLNMNNMVDFDKQDVSYGTSLWGVGVTIWIRLKAEINNQTKLLRIVEELRASLTRNKTGVLDYVLSAPNWSGKTYKLSLDKNQMLIDPIISNEPFGTNITYYTAVTEFRLWIGN